MNNTIAMINKLNEDKKNYIIELEKQNILSKDIFGKIDNIVLEIENYMIEMEKNENIDLGKVNNFLNKLILHKVFLNKQISSFNYFKGKYDVVKANTKLKAISDSYSDGEIGLKGNSTDIITIKMDDFVAFQNIIQDLLIKIKNTKDLVDSTIMVLQSQLKNISFEYINAAKISI